MSIIRTGFIVLCLSWGFSLQAQDDLLGQLEGEEEETTEYTSATFKGTKVINGQSCEIPGKGVLQFMILHRFGAVNDDFLYNFFGLDNANVRFGLDYSFNEWLNLGFGRSSFQKTYDGFAKYKILRQSTGKRTMPVSVVGYSAAYINTERFTDDRPHRFSDRLSYSHQLIIARKFSPNLSLQVVPSLVHYNLQQTRAQDNTIFAVGLSGRYKLTNRISLNLEYFPQINPNTYLREGEEVPYNNTLSVGVDIETGGHVFQLHLTNSRGMIDPQFMTSNNQSWMDGGIFFGFNISRVFTIVKPESKEPDW